MCTVQKKTQNGGLWMEPEFLMDSMQEWICRYDVQILRDGPYDF